MKAAIEITNNEVPERLWEAYSFIALKEIARTHGVLIAPRKEIQVANLRDGVRPPRLEHQGPARFPVKLIADIRTVYSDHHMCQPKL